MKPIHLSLASKPPREKGRAFMVLAVLALITGFLMVNNLQTAYQYFTSTKSTRLEIGQIEQSIANEEKRALMLDSQIRKVNLKALNAQVNFVNSQISEKAFSWSALLDQLETVMPRDVRLLSLDPQIGKNGETHLAIRAMSKTPDGLVRLLDRLLGDSHFVRPFPQGENTTPTGMQQFTLSTTYRPDAAGVR